MLSSLDNPCVCDWIKRRDMCQMGCVRCLILPFKSPFDFSVSQTVTEIIFFPSSSYILNELPGGWSKNFMLSFTSAEAWFRQNSGVCLGQDGCVSACFWSWSCSAGQGHRWPHIWSSWRSRAAPQQGPWQLSSLAQCPLSPGQSVATAMVAEKPFSALQPQNVAVADKICCSYHQTDTR